MSRPILEVDGGRRLRATLKAAGDDLTDLKGTHARVGQIVAARARGTAPSRTGELIGTIRASGTKTAAYVRAGYKRTPYAGPNEWGWSQGSPVRGSFGGEHWMTKAAKDTEPQWVNLYVSEVNQALAKVKGK